MSTVEELREERRQLEALQNQIRTIDTAVEDAKRAEESAESSFKLRRPACEPQATQFAVVCSATL